MTKLEIFLIIVILAGLGGIAYVATRPPRVENNQYKTLIDSLQRELDSSDVSLTRLYDEIKKVSSKKDSVTIKYIKIRESIAGADERTLDSLILEYVNDSL